MTSRPSTVCTVYNIRHAPFQKYSSEKHWHSGQYGNCPVCLVTCGTFSFVWLSHWCRGTWVRWFKPLAVLVSRDTLKEIWGVVSKSPVCLPLKHDKQLLLQSSSAAYTSSPWGSCRKNCEGTKALSACLAGIKVTFWRFKFFPTLLVLSGVHAGQTELINPWMSTACKSLPSVN